jgi:hypothetical protein
MANTFTKSTKSSLSTNDVTSSATTNVVSAGGTATLIVLSVLISNKTSSSANANLYLLPNTGDAAFLIKNAPIPAGSSLEMIGGSKIIMNSSDVLRASSDTASALDITVSYLQQTP